MEAELVLLLVSSARVHFGRLAHGIARPLIAATLTGLEVAARLLCDGIAVVHEEIPARLQDAVNLLEDGQEGGHVVAPRWFEAELPIDAIVTQCPIRRRGHAAVDTLAGQCREEFPDIAE